MICYYYVVVGKIQINYTMTSNLGAGSEAGGEAGGVGGVGLSLSGFKERCKEMNERYTLLHTIYSISRTDMTYTYNDRMEIAAEMRTLGSLIITYEAIIYYKTNKDLQKDSLEVFMNKLQRTKITSDVQSFYFYEWIPAMKELNGDGEGGEGGEGAGSGL